MDRGNLSRLFSQAIILSLSNDKVYAKQGRVNHHSSASSQASKKPHYMIILLLLILIIGILAIAGITKWRDYPGTRRAILEFGFPSIVAPFIGRILPITEVGLAVALCVPFARTAAAISSTALFIIFTVLVALTLARGHKVTCNCFGQLGAKPISIYTFFRNLSLTMVSAFLSWLLWTGGSSILPELSGWQVAGLFVTFAFGLLLTIQSYLLYHLMRQNGRLLERLEHLERRAVVSDTPTQNTLRSAWPRSLERESEIPFPTLDGNLVSLASLRSEERPLLLVFADPLCGACESLLPDLAAWYKSNGELVILVIASRGSTRGHRLWPSKYGFPTVMLQQNDELLTAFAVPATPTAFLLPTAGGLSTPSATGADAIRSLLTEIKNQSVPGIQEIEPSPTGSITIGVDHLSLLAPWQGQPLMLVFWDSSCVHCEKILYFFNSESPALGARGFTVLLVVHNSDTITNFLPYKFIVRDPGRQISQAFGISVVPAAVVIDSTGSPQGVPALGANAVATLLQSSLSSNTAFHLQ